MLPAPTSPLLEPGPHSMRIFQADTIDIDEVAVVVVVFKVPGWDSVFLFLITGQCRSVSFCPELSVTLHRTVIRSVPATIQHSAVLQLRLRKYPGFAWIAEDAAGFSGTAFFEFRLLTV